MEIITEIRHYQLKPIVSVMQIKRIENWNTTTSMWSQRSSTD